jgi:hypothetical protein
MTDVSLQGTPNGRVTTVAIESPFAGNARLNVRYALACMRFAFKEGCAPFASHMLYTMTLRDMTPNERKLGMKAGFAFADACEFRWLCTDLGEPSSGMKAGVARAKKRNQPVVTVQIGEGWPDLIRDIPDAQIDALVYAMTHGEQGARPSESNR